MAAVTVTHRLDKCVASGKIVNLYKMVIVIFSLSKMVTTSLDAMKESQN